jgi:hypothetical protein
VGELLGAYGTMEVLQRMCILDFQPDAPSPALTPY